MLHGPWKLRVSLWKSFSLIAFAVPCYPLVADGGGGGGVYFYRLEAGDVLEAGDFVASRKMVLLR